jgi:Tfp pilus assembly protein PilX
MLLRRDNRLWPQRRRDLGEERGTALVLALIIGAALTISTAALITLVSSNERAYGRDRQAKLAFDTAEAGLNYGISTLAQTGDPVGAAALNSTYGTQASPIPFNGSTGSGEWWATKTAPRTWTLWATGTSPNGRVERNVSVKVRSATQVGTTIPASLAWGYGLFVANPGPNCFTPGGTADLTISIYVNGCILLSGNVGIAEPAASTGPSVEVYAKTTLSFQGGSAQIGASTRPILSVIAPQGCTGRQGYICNQTPQSRVWATAYTGPFPDITKPAMNPDADAYSLTDWSQDWCSVGSFTFDNDTTRNTSLGTVNLFPASSYSCTVLDSGGGVVGTLNWNAATNVLTGTGKIFIDGNLHLNSNTASSYPAGTSLALYVDGTVQMNGTAAFCGPPSVPSGGTCSTPSWDSSQGAIVIIAVNHEGNNNPFAVGWHSNGSVFYDVAAYVVGNYTSNGNSGVTGPIITDTASVSGSGSTADMPNPPPGTPGAQTTSPGSTVWGVIPATWQQLPNS